MSEPTDIERIVMRRVRAVRVLRPIFSNAAIAALLLVAALWGIGREVWVARVFENGPQGIVGHTEYLAYAFAHTRLIVQALTLSAAAAALYLAQSVARALAAGITAFA